MGRPCKSGSPPPRGWLSSACLPFPQQLSPTMFQSLYSLPCRVTSASGVAWWMETPVPVRCGSPCRLRLTTSPGPRSADSASSSHLSGCFSDGLTPGASYCMHHLAPQMLFLKTPTFQRLSLSPAEAPRPLTPGLPRGGPGSRSRVADVQSTCSVQGRPARLQTEPEPALALLAPHADGKPARPRGFSSERTP